MNTLSKVSIGGILAVMVSQTLICGDLNDNLETGESKRITIKVEHLKGKNIKIDPKIKREVAPDEAFEWFFDTVKNEFGLDFGASIEEQANPISFHRRSSNRHVKIDLSDYHGDASVVFSALVAQSKWHWSYGDRGQIVIHAWHEGDLEK